MKTFKSFLAESAVASFSAIDMEMEDLIDCYRNAGYEVQRRELKYFIQSKYEKYDSKSKQHVYIVMMEDDNEEGFYLTRFFVSLGPEGRVIAEPSGMPFFENENEEVVFDKFQDM